MILKFEEKLASNITNMKRHEPNVNNMKRHEASVTNMKKHEPKIMVKYINQYIEVFKITSAHPPDENISFTRFKYSLITNSLTRSSHSLVWNNIFFHHPPDEKISLARFKYSYVPPPDENISFSRFKYTLLSPPWRENLLGSFQIFLCPTPWREDLILSLPHPPNEKFSLSRL